MRRATGTMPCRNMSATIIALEANLRLRGQIDNFRPHALIRAPMRKVFLLCTLPLLLAASAPGGTEPPAPVVRQDVSDVFAKGSKEFENVTGVFYFFDRGGNDGPSVDLAVDSIRLGYMLSNPHGSGFFAGNYELLGEAFGGSIFQGPGSVEAGATLIFRYNFIQPRARFIPYMQIGAGGIYTDISQRDSRGLVSLPVEFNLQGSGGLRFMLNPKCSILLEAGYRHISNASIKLPNRGVDSVGGDLGFGFFF
ncbi:MAG: acyloxyacyl hydrolase [Chthoniobacterales bacterium]